MLLKDVAPHVNWRYVFTDTGAEERENIESLDRLEAYLGKPIERIMKDEKGLFELIEDFGGFLPGPRDRYCTKYLKLLPFQNWILQFEGRNIWMFVGIRADEEGRLAFAIDGAETIFPFIELGITRSWVYRKLADTIGIPKFYATRTRSGCTVCPFQRTSEIIGLLERSPLEFIRGASLEKLSEEDVVRHPEGTPFWKDSGVARNWLSLPKPDSARDLEGRLKNARKADLFGTRIFVGAEMFVDGFPGYEEFVWHQRIVCFSTTLAGVKQQLDGRYKHIRNTSEVYDMEPDDVLHKAKFAVYYIELPSDVLDTAGPQPGSYTWHSGKSYNQIRHIVQWSERALHAEHQRQQASTTPNELSVQYEWMQSAKACIEKAMNPLGNVVLSQWYQPTDIVRESDDEEEVLRRTPCPMCSL
jgi:3'-phosphoadenosine 5'-phosphosulfate sulfotransferase (PAPS reductase)/FAD synthetase